MAYRTFFEELFRATKEPTIILLIGFLVVPAALSIYVVANSSMDHSARPLQLFLLGFVQVLIGDNPQLAQTLPPNLAVLMRAATQADKQLGKEIFAGVLTLGLLDGVAVIWWIDSAFTFLERKPKGKGLAAY